MMHRDAYGSAFHPRNAENTTFTTIAGVELSHYTCYFSSAVHSQILQSTRGRSFGNPTLLPDSQCIIGMLTDQLSLHLDVRTSNSRLSDFGLALAAVLRRFGQPKTPTPMGPRWPDIMPKVMSQNSSSCKDLLIKWTYDA